MPLIHSPYLRTLFGELATANLYTLGDYQGYTGLDAEQYVQTTATGGTITADPNNARIALTVTASSGSRAFLRTKRQHHYQAAREQRTQITIEHADAGQTNQTRRWGYFDDGDGLFFQLVGTTLSIVRRTSVTGSPVDNNIARSTWNVDKFDGTGPSGVTLNLLNGSIYEIRFQYLGVGAVCFLVNGYLAHVLDNANQLPTVYMRCPHLPLAFEVINTGASTGLSMYFNCGNVSALGGELPPEYSYGYPQVRAGITAGTEVYGFSIRPATLFNTLQNRMEVHPISVGIQSETNRASIRLLLNATLTGTTWAVTPPTGSGCDIDIAGAYASGGVEIFTAFAPNNGTGGAALWAPLTALFPKLGRSLKRWSTTAVDCDVLTLLITNETTGTTDVKAHLGWAEVR